MPHPGTPPPWVWTAVSTTRPPPGPTSTGWVRGEAVSTHAGSRVASYGQRIVTGVSAKAMLSSASCPVASTSAAGVRPGPARPGQAGSPTKRIRFP